MDILSIEKLVKTVSDKWHAMINKKNTKTKNIKTSKQKQTKTTNNKRKKEKKKKKKSDLEHYTRTSTIRLSTVKNERDGEQSVKVFI